MSDIDALLTEFEAKIESDDRAAAADIVDEIDEYFDSLEESERRISSQRQTAELTADFSADEVGTLNDYSSTHAAADLTRGSFVSLASLYLLEPDQMEDQELFDAVDQLRDLESSFSDLKEQAESVLDTVSLPASIVARTSIQETRPYLKGQQITITVSLANVGGAESKKLTAGSESELPIEPEQIEVGALESGEELDTKFDVTLENQGEYSVSFDILSGSELITKKSLSIRSHGKKELMQAARDIVHRIQNRIRDLDEIDGGREKSLLQQLTGAERHLDRANEELEDGRVEQANNALNTSSKNLGAFLNHFEALQNSNQHAISEGIAFSIRNQADGAIENVSVAKSARV